MSTRHDGSEGPEDIDAAFAEIVAELEHDSSLARWSRDFDEAAAARPGEESTEDSAASADQAADGEGGGKPAGTAMTGESAEPAPHEDEGHFEPPEPPPLPALRPATIGGLVLIGLGFALLLVTSISGLYPAFLLPVALLSISAGIGWLVLRMRQDPPESDWDDGAQV